MTPLAVNRFVAGILDDVAGRETKVPFQEIKARSRDAPAPRDAEAAVLRSGCSVIVEIKRAFPHREAIHDIDSVAGLARGIEEAGAHLIACQTEELRFHGSMEDMWEARSAVELPMVCRDIIVDPYQIHEARFYGADVVPLQVGLLEQARFVSLADRIESLGMTVLAEVRTPEEADRAIQAGIRAIGINAWSIASDEFNKDTFTDLVPGLPQEILRIALGGVRTSRDLLSYAANGADAVLVGEAVMSAEDPLQAARALAAVGQHPACPSR